MNIVNCPPDYQGVYSDIIYKIQVEDPDSFTDVSVIGNGTVLGIKRFRGEADVSINCGPYLRKLFDIYPFSNTLPTGLYADDMKTIEARIGIGKTLSDPVALTSGFASCPQLKALSNCPDKNRIGKDECDEICFIAPERKIFTELTFFNDNEYTTLAYEQTTVTKRAYTFFINMKEIYETHQGLNHYRNLKLEIYADDNVIIEKDYQIIPDNSQSTRMAWLNPYGCIDYYSFSHTIETGITASKEKIYTIDGYKTIRSSFETTYKVSSSYVPIAEIRWLSELNNSPRAWIVDSDICPIDITSYKTEIVTNKPNRTEITYRHIKKTLCQTN